jgi:HEAT repeat protein
MGLFDLFKSGGNAKKARDGEGKGTEAATAAAKWAEKAGDKRAQNYDRQEAIAELAEMGTPEAAAALLKRFTFNIDPSITDQEEKDGAYHGVLAAGQGALPAIRSFAGKAESLAWPIKLVKALLGEEAYVEELLLWLGRWDTEYAKFIDPKLQLLSALEEFKNPAILPKVEPFLEDVNGDARFLAVGAVLAQENESAIPALLAQLEQEESLRVKNRVLDGFANRGWVVPEDSVAKTRKVLPPDYSIDAQGVVVKR